MADFHGKLAFNWTSTYRTDSDVPSLYGEAVKYANKTLEEETELKKFIGERPKLIASVISNCRLIRNGRLTYIKELANHTQVDQYGDCGKLKWEGHNHGQGLGEYCSKLDEYNFFLAFENSNCKDYITEKFWLQGLIAGPVPVVMGAPKEDYLRVAPPNSFVHVDDFESPEHLARYLVEVARNETAYMGYHKWR